MNQYLTKYFLLPLFIFVLSLANGFAQKTSSGINIGAKIGTSRLLTEIPTDFSGAINEFDNDFGFSTSFEISKFVSSHLEIGTEFGLYMLKGMSNDPLSFSAQGNHAAFPGPPNQVEDPVEYQNNLIGQNFFFRYHFKSTDEESKFSPYVRTGLGYKVYKAKLQYTSGEAIFGKGHEGYTDLSTLNILLGTGFRTSLSSNIYILAAFDINIVNYDFLDVVHNYNSIGGRIDMFGIYTDLSVGIFYNFGNSSSSSSNSNKRKKKNKSGHNHLPFSRR